MKISITGAYYSIILMILLIVVFAPILTKGLTHQSKSVNNQRIDSLNPQQKAIIDTTVAQFERDGLLPKQKKKPILWFDDSNNHLLYALGFLTLCLSSIFLMLKYPNRKEDDNTGVNFKVWVAIIMGGIGFIYFIVKYFMNFLH